jgi:hypothetical protein
VTKHGFYKTDGVPRSGWTEVKHQNTSQTDTASKGYGYWLVVGNGFIHYNFLNPGKTITEVKYC